MRCRASRSIRTTPTIPNINFKQGENDKVLTIPPGPNGPVGSVWIALDKPTYGIHGTPDPSKIGKTESHGCVRLTNWDARELAKLVKPGVTVEFVGETQPMSCGHDPARCAGCGRWPSACWTRHAMAAGAHADAVSSSEAAVRVANGTFCPPAARRFVLIAAILASALGFIDGSILAIAMPAIRVDLGASLADAQWISNAYALTLSALILAGGAAGDRFGLRRAFVAGIALFIVASLACALAPNAALLIAVSRHPGHRRRDHGAGQPRHHRQSLSEEGARPGDRHLGGGLGADHGARSGARRPGAVGLRRLASGGRSSPSTCRSALISIYLLLAKVPADAPTEKRSLDLGGAALATLAFGALAYGLTSMSAEGERT